MNSFKHCIVSFVDLIDTKKKLSEATKSGINLMRQMHGIVNKHMNDNMPLHDHAYYWNDSVLLLAYVDIDKICYQPVMMEVNSLKKEVNKLCKSFVISIKGMTIPQIEEGPTDQSKCTYLKVSSMAFSNCFIVEKGLKGQKKEWYVDSRIAKNIKTDQKMDKVKIALLPRNWKREIYLFDGDLW